MPHQWADLKTVVLPGTQEFFPVAELQVLAQVPTALRRMTVQPVLTDWS